MLTLLFSLALQAPAEDPVARCASFGDVALLGDIDKYKVAQYLVKKNVHPCILYHAAMAKVRLTEKTPSRFLLASAIDLLSKIDSSADPALYDWARIRRLELAARLREPRLAPERADLPKSLPNPDRRFLMETALVAVDAPAMALQSHLAHPLQGRHRLAQIADMMLLVEKGSAEKAALEKEIADDYPDSWLAPKETTNGPPLTEDALLKKMAQWHGRHANNQVIATAYKALRSNDISAGARCVILFFQGAAERKLRHYSLAERALSEAMVTCRPFGENAPPTTSKNTPIALIASSANAPPPTPADAYKRAWFLLGQVQGIARPAETAHATLTGFVEKYKDDALADDALLHAAAAAKKAGDHGAARTFMERLVKEQASGDMCAEASFRLAWQRYREDDPVAAAQAFAALPNNGCAQDETQVARAHYWRARSLTRAKASPEDVSQALLAAFNAAPMHYYGMVARLRLKNELKIEVPLPAEVATAAPTEMGPPLAASGPTVNVLEDRIQKLASIGLYQEAQQELTQAKPGDAPLEEMAAYTRLLSVAHDYSHAHRPFRATLRTALGVAPSPRTRSMWETAYPRPFALHFLKSEKEEKLPKDLLLSVVREESAFQLDAGSWANAYGMTQLLVETAERTAADIPGFSKVVTADLLRKEALVSLQLGAHLLSMLQKRYKSPPLMLAAYNAGEDAVDHWLRSRGGLPVDEFIEEIPFDETRGYVKRILSTWQIYRNLGGFDAPAVSLGRTYRTPIEVVAKD